MHRILAFVLMLALGGLFGIAPAEAQVLLPAGTPNLIPGKGAPVCGGIVNGKPQTEGCPSKPAHFESEVGYQCPAGSFFDANGGCYQCPAGYQRTAEAVTSDRACAKADASISGGQMAATFGGGLCKGGFFDIIRGGECWSCDGWQRTAASVESGDACAPPSGFGRATRLRSGLIQTCSTPNSNFFDIWDGGGCWSCPAGSVRTADHINSDRACQLAARPARLLGKAQCGVGEFLDPRNGGECWSCPASTTRTVFPVHEGRACERWGGYVYAKATQARSDMLTCGAGRIFDAATGKNPNVQARVRAQFTEEKKAMPAIGQSNGGTCWTCPVSYSRSTSPVWEAGACTATFIWGSPPYLQPGLFGLDGGEAVALALIKERNLINTIADSLVPQLAPNSAEARKKVWDEIATAPQNSAVLRLAALARLQVAAATPGQASADERRLANAFANEVVKFRSFIAQQALEAYDAWKVAEDYARGQRTTFDDGSGKRKANLSIMVDGGLPPPDFEQIAKATILGGLGTGAGLVFAGTMALVGSKAIATAIFPLLGTEEFSMNVAALGGASLSVGIAAAPAAIAVVAIQMAIIAIVQIEQMVNARPRLLAGLASAQQAVDLNRLLRTNDGKKEFRNHWMTAMGGDVAPQQLAVLASAAKLAAQQSAQQQGAQAPQAAAQGGWIKLDGAGNEIAIGANGALWVLGTNQSDPNGFDIYRRDGNAWTRIQGAGTRIAVDPAGMAWLVNRKGQIYKWNGSQWSLVAGPAASDIAIGRSGKVWILGMAPESGGFGIHRLDGTNWVKVPGAGTRIAVDTIGNAAVVSSNGNIYYYNGSAWQQMTGAAVDIAIGAAGHVWVLGTNKVSGGNGLFRWDGANWVATSGGLTSLAVASDGKPLGINANREIWRMQ